MIRKEERAFKTKYAQRLGDLNDVQNAAQASQVTDLSQRLQNDRPTSLEQFKMVVDQKVNEQREIQLRGDK